MGVSSKSTFSQLAVVVDQRLKIEEVRVLNYIESDTRKPNDILFATREGHTTSCSAMVSLVTDFLVVPQMIDCWAVLLNIEEDKRSKNSPYRLFCHTRMMTSNMADIKMDESLRLRLFKSHLSEVLNGNPVMMKMIGVDMVFFPILHGNHYYLVVFDFKSRRFVIIDNENDTKSIEDKYKGVPDILHKVFISYLMEIGHSKVNRIMSANPERMRMKWQTSKRTDDDGVFVMRHMETYMGQMEGRWNCELGTE